MLDLVERLVDGGRVVVRVLKLENDQRQSIDIDEDVGDTPRTTGQIAAALRTLS